MSRRVLVADDAAFMRQMIREIIEPEGFEVVGEATDGLEVVETFREVHPELVMLDIVMPKCSGIDALRRILAVDPSARVVMCSALGQESLVQEALQAGARGFIVKPFKPDAVVATLRQVAEKPDA
jgi:two-component system chemotaxis response regulator CheY